ncbi:MAG: hypothetical protein DRP78_06310 [Candidatus Omnitrophota bacterium]|nr:MAG: hypothetical protein DRP78_06310 [Candidatus Omnitrophota bacterium]
MSLFFCDFCFTREAEPDYDALIASCRKIFNQNQNNKKVKKQLSVLYHNYGNELAKQEKWLKAIQNEKQAYKLCPDEQIIQETLSSLYNAYAGTLKEQGKLQECLHYLQSALDYFQGNPRIGKNISVVYTDLAYQEFMKSNYWKCKQFLNKAADFDQENASLYVLRGELAYNQDDYDEAAKNWEKALEFNSELSEVRERLEKMQKEKGLERNFKTIRTGSFKIKFAAAAKHDLADSVVKILQNAYRDVGQNFNTFPNSVIQVIIYPEEKLANLGYFPDWAGGIYDGKIRFGEQVGEHALHMKPILYHEYTHVLVRILAGNNAPLWLNEGLAEYEAKPFKKVKMRKARKQLLLKAVRKDELFDFTDIAQMNLTQLGQLESGKIELVYAQSEYFVSYLINRFSLYHLVELLGCLGKGDTIDQAIDRTFYFDLNTLVTDWKNKMRG